MNSQCYNNYNVGYQFKLQATINNFIENLMNFLSVIQRILNTSSNKVIINSITESSVIINGSVEVETA